MNSFFNKEDKALAKVVTSRLLSYGHWNRSSGHNCDVVGRSLSIKGVPFTIAGVAGPRFIGLGGNPTDIWIPLQSRPDFDAWGSQDENYYAAPNWWCLPLAARLAPGVNKSQAEVAAASVFRRAAYAHLGGKPRAGEKAPVLQLPLPAIRFGSRRRL
jgi:hypothetical protein